MEDKRHGEGRFIWRDNREYEGGWDKGKQSGVGYYLSHNGVKRKGFWVDGRRQRWCDEEDQTGQ